MTSLIAVFFLVFIAISHRLMVSIVRQDHSEASSSSSPLTATDAIISSDDLTAHILSMRSAANANVNANVNDTATECQSTSSSELMYLAERVVHRLSDIDRGISTGDIGDNFLDVEVLGTFTRELGSQLSLPYPKYFSSLAGAMRGLVLKCLNSSGSHAVDSMQFGLSLMKCLLASSWGIGHGIWLLPVYR